MALSDAALADELITRLNAITDKSTFIKEDVGKLLETLCPCSPEAERHPSLQVRDVDGKPHLGPLGLLNGLVGAIPDGPKAGWGYITAEFDAEDGTFERFVRTGPPVAPRVETIRIDRRDDSGCVADAFLAALWRLGVVAMYTDEGEDSSTVRIVMP